MGSHIFILATLMLLTCMKVQAYRNIDSTIWNCNVVQQGTLQDFSMTIGQTKSNGQRNLSLIKISGEEIPIADACDNKDGYIECHWHTDNYLNINRIDKQLIVANKTCYYLDGQLKFEKSAIVPVRCALDCE